jgi:4-amino-4-deoxy-L-arabinose transferase-like glycosyltransferase
MNARMDSELDVTVDDNTPIDSSREPGWRRTLLEVALVAAFTLLMTLPFLARPFDMDDVIFLKIAEARLDDPLLLQIKDFVFFGVFNPTFIDTHPPLVSTWLALVMKLSGGESEIWLHLAFVIFPLIASLSMYFLARHFTRNALPAALILAATPGIVAMSHTLMSDLPGVAFWLAATAFYVYGLERRSLPLMVLSAVSLTLGIFSAYVVLAALPLLFFYALARKQLSLLTLLPLVLPISTFISFTVWYLVATGSPPSLSYIHYTREEPLAAATIFQKLISLAATLGGAAVFPLVLWRLISTRKNDIAVYTCLLVPVAVWALVRYYNGEYGIAETVLLVLLVPLGAMLLYWTFAAGWQRTRQFRDGRSAQGVLVLLWSIAVLVSVVVFLPYSSVRYLLPLFPPVVLAFVWLVEERLGADSPGSKNLLAATVLATAAIGLLVAQADYELADSKRLFAENEAVALGERAAAGGNKLWFSSEFGVRYYMERQGFEELAAESVLNEGDLIVLPLLAGSDIPTSEQGSRLQLVDDIAPGALSPLRITDHRAGAGFYGSRWGLLPYSFSTGSIEEYLIYRVAY